MWTELERRGAVYARILFSVQEGQARVDAVILYDGYAPPWHHELGEVEPDSHLGVALWVLAAGGTSSRAMWFRATARWASGARARSEYGVERPPPARKTARLAREPLNAVRVRVAWTELAPSDGAK